MVVKDRRETPRTLCYRLIQSGGQKTSVTTNMATETVSAFTPVSLNFNKDTINSYALKCENDLNFDDHATVADIKSPIAQTYYKRVSEMAGREMLSKQRDQEAQQQQQRIVERKRQEYVKLENIKTEINLNENNHTSGNNIPNHLDKQEDDANNGKKKRNTKKRNRSDMPPEELMRLRERERKAQQSRRDRIRAQKRHAQGWHDDDAAWEAFLDQAENNIDKTAEDLKPNFVSTLPPSMVCSITSRNSPKDEMFSSDISSVELNLVNRDIKCEMKQEDEEEVERIVNGHHDMKKMIQKQDSVHSNDTDTNSAGSYLETQSVNYSSDDKPNEGSLHEDQKENGKKKLSRRHYLPSDELERLRKRERETKRRQRERHRLANSESTSPVKSNSTLSSNDTEYIDDMVNESDVRSTESKHYDSLLNSEHFKSIDQHHAASPDNKAMPLVVPPKSLSSDSPHSAVSPHSHHHPSNHHRHYPPIVYKSHPHHHHYSHSPTQYLREEGHRADSHYPRYVVDDHHYHSESYKLDSYHKNHGSLPHVIPVPHRSNKNGMSSPEQKPKHASNTSPTNNSNEKKKLISRNVDRKSLSEEELEELRRRERDYQRERRARIRLEKAKSQANHEQYTQKSRDDGLNHYYHHQSPVYRPHSALHMYPDDLHHRDREKTIHVIPNCESEDRYEYRQYSPHYHAKNSSERKELGVTIPPSNIRTDRKTHSSDELKDNDLLQVVPKTRECEEMSTSPPQVTPNKPTNIEENGDSKKNVLENICSTLKKETDEWTENSGSFYGDNDDNDDGDDKLVIVHPSSGQEKEEDEVKNSDVENSHKNGVSKDELTKSTTASSAPSSKANDDMTLRDRIMEDQLERRRRSNREAQRRRRARLKIQESSEERPDSSDEVIDYELMRASKSMHHYSDNKHSNHGAPKGCRMKITPQIRSDSYDDYHSYHGHHNGKLPYHPYERYSSHGPPTHKADEHCYYSSHRSLKEESHRYPHYFREQNKIERYMHDLPVHYSHHGNSPRIHEYNDSKKCARVPSIDSYDHHEDIHRNENNRNVDKIPSTSSSPNLITPKADIENEFEPSKQCGRKRKQQAPRKVVSSSNTPEDSEVDVCGVGESPEEKSIYKDTDNVIKSNKILQLNGESNYKNISSQQNLDDMLYLYR